MTRRFCLAILICIATLSAKAQYVQYDPLPYVPEPEVAPPTPQYNYPTPPVPNYPPPTSNDEKILDLFLIESATANNRDVTSNYTSANAQIAIYTKNGNLNMAVCFVKTNSQSYGVITDLQTTAIPATSRSYRGIQRTFKWHYRNTYNEDTGEADVFIIQIDKSDGIYFACQVKSTYLTSDYQGHQLR